MTRIFLLVLLVVSSICLRAEEEFVVKKGSIEVSEVGAVPTYNISTAGYKFTFVSPGESCILQIDRSAKKMIFSPTNYKFSIVFRVTTNFPGALPTQDVLKGYVLNEFPGSQIIRSGPAPCSAENAFEFELTQVVGRNLIQNRRHVIVPFKNGSLECSYAASTADFLEQRMPFLNMLRSLQISAP